MVLLAKKMVIFLRNVLTAMNTSRTVELSFRFEQKTKLLAIRTRWPGDGMENSEIRSSENVTVTRPSILGTLTNTRSTTTPAPGQNLIYQATEPSQPPPIKPKGKIFNLVPRLIVSNKQFSLKTKEPRFIPFEPYKGAVNPIIPLQHTKKVRNRNNLDLNTLVAHMSDMKAIDLHPNKTATANTAIVTAKEFEELKKERDSLAMQLKSQVQVNAELKNLLVAAVGEDLQTRVNVLTEDKLQLARALLSSAKNLSSHTVSPKIHNRSKMNEKKN